MVTITRGDYMRSYRTSHLEGMRAAARRYYLSHREEVLGRMRAMRARLVKKERQCGICFNSFAPRTNDKYCDRCKDAGAKIQQQNWFYRMGRFCSPRGNDWNLIRHQVMARDGGVCRWCFGGSELHVHHILEWNGDRRLNHRGNLISLCEKCHGRGHRVKCFVFHPVDAFKVQHEAFIKLMRSCPA